MFVSGMGGHVRVTRCLSRRGRPESDQPFDARCATTPTWPSQICMNGNGSGKLAEKMEEALR